jgi:hypothetical protein
MENKDPYSNGFQSILITFSYFIYGWLIINLALVVIDVLIGITSGIIHIRIPGFILSDSFHSINTAVKIVIYIGVGFIFVARMKYLEKNNKHHTFE